MNNPPPKQAGQQLEADRVPGDATPALNAPAQDTGPCPSYADTSTEIYPLPAFVTWEIAPTQDTGPFPSYARKSTEICPLPAFVTREMSPSC